jgi:hypothetical protein
MIAGIGRLAGFVLGLLLLSNSISAQTHRRKPDPCDDTSNMTQAQMNDCAVKQLITAESAMKTLLKRLGIAPRRPCAESVGGVPRRSDGCDIPSDDASSRGSVDPLCEVTSKRYLTEGRIRDLKTLTRTREGDVCSGYRLVAANATNSPNGCSRRNSGSGPSVGTR